MSELEEINTETPEEQPEKTGRSLSVKKMVLNVLIVFFVGLVTTLGFFYIWLPGTTNHGETITVPDLVERNMDELEEMLVGRGLRYEVNDSAYSSQYPPYTILQQYPTAGSKVKEGRKIFLSVNRKSIPMISFPEGLFAGEKSLTHVKAVLSNMDVDIERTLVRKGPFFNLVLEARYEGEPIEEGQLIPKGSSVVVVVSDGYGNTTFEMPMFWGVPYDEVDVTRKGMDLNMEPLIIKRGIDTTGRELIVVRQKPDPGTTIRLGEMITIWADVELDSTYYFELYPDTTSYKIDVIDTLGITIDSTGLSSNEN